LAVLQQPTVLEQRALAPMAVLPPPEVFEKRAFKPVAVFRAPEVFEKRALHPSAVRDAVVQPRTIPATVGVAALPPAVPQQMALLPFDISTWPAVPQEPAQSMIPAPGLMALVEVPVSQFSVAEKPMASWQEPVAYPRVTLRHAVVAALRDL